MKLYVARHGQTQWNVENKVCGRTDIGLTALGMEQAQTLAQEAKKCNLDMIISSPMLRAYQTAEAVADVCAVPILTDERLIEQNYGIYEGVDRKDPAFLANKRNFAFRYPGGESMMDLAHRVYGLLNEIQHKYAGKDVLLVCHGGVCRVIHTYFEDLSNDDYFHYNMPNAKLKQYEYGKGEVK